MTIRKTQILQIQVVKVGGKPEMTIHKRRQPFKNHENIHIHHGFLWKKRSPQWPMRSKHRETPGVDERSSQSAVPAPSFRPVTWATNFRCQVFPLVVFFGGLVIRLNMITLGYFGLKIGLVPPWMVIRTVWYGTCVADLKQKQRCYPFLSLNIAMGNLLQMDMGQWANGEIIYVYRDWKHCYVWLPDGINSFDCNCDTWLETHVLFVTLFCAKCWFGVQKNHETAKKM